MHGAAGPRGQGRHLPGQHWRRRRRRRSRRRRVRRGRGRRSRYVFTFTFRAFSRRFYPKQLTIRAFVIRKRNN